MLIFPEVSACSSDLPVVSLGAGAIPETQTQELEVWFQIQTVTWDN